MKKTDYSNQEIELKVFLKMLNKRKTTVLFFFFVSIIISLAINLLISKKYEVSQVLIPPALDITTELDSPKNIKKNIEYINII